MVVHYPGQDLDVLAQDADIITMGITPTGEGLLHQGHYVTLMNLFRTLASSKAINARIFVDDREFHNQEKPRLATNHVIGRMEEVIESFVLSVASYLHDDSIIDRYEIVRMSNFLSTKAEFGGNSAGHDLLRMINGNKSLLRRLFSEMPYLYNCPVKPLCYSCNTGARQIADVKSDADRLSSLCDEEGCENCGQPYTVDVSRGDIYWSIFYTLVGLRDVIMAGGDKAVLHVYGGDYGMDWGRRSLPKAERIQLLTRSVLSEMLIRRGDFGESPVINHYVGPLLKRRGARKKLSKSSGDFSDGRDLQRFESWARSKDRVIEI